MNTKLHIFIKQTLSGNVRKASERIQKILYKKENSQVRGNSLSSGRDRNEFFKKRLNEQNNSMGLGRKQN